MLLFFLNPKVDFLTNEHAYLFDNYNLKISAKIQILSNYF